VFFLVFVVCFDWVVLWVCGFVVVRVGCLCCFLGVCFGCFFFVCLVSLGSCGLFVYCFEFFGFVGFFVLCCVFICGFDL